MHCEIKDLLVSDFPKAALLVKNAWPELINPEFPVEVQNARPEMYLLHNLRYSDRAVKAVCDGKLCGILISRSPDEGRMFPTDIISQRMKVLGSILNEDPDKIDQPDPLKKALTPDFDSEIMLLIVAAEYQGRGFGRALVEDYFSYCKNNGRKTVYLITDTLCGYTFYERLGFKKQCEDHKKFGAEMNNVEMDSFLYAKQLN